MNDPQIKPQINRHDLAIICGLLLFACWTVSYHAVLISRMPASTAIILTMVILPTAGWQVLSRCRAEPICFRWRHVCLAILSVGCGLLASVILRPDADDIEFFHRALVQLNHLGQPIFLNETVLNVQGIPTISSAHIATSYELLAALTGKCLGFDPIFFCQVVVCVLFSALLPLLYYRIYRELGLQPTSAVVAVLLAVTFLYFVDGNTHRSYGNVAFVRLWQGKTLLWTYLLPLTFLLALKYLRDGLALYAFGLLLASIAAVGLSNSGIYLNPVLTGCVAAAYVAAQKWQRLPADWRRAALTVCSSGYCIAFALLLKSNTLPPPSYTSAWIAGWPQIWWENLYLVPGDHWTLVRDILILFALPFVLPSVRQRNIVLAYSAMLVVVCFNPLSGKFWMSAIYPGSYWRLMYLLPVPLGFGLLSVPLLAAMKRTSRHRLIVAAALVASVVISFKASPLSRENVSLKWPWEPQCAKDQLTVAKAAREFLDHRNVLATSELSVVLPLFNSTIRLEACRGVEGRFANAHDSSEGERRLLAQKFVETGDLCFAPAFEKSLETGVNALVISRTAADRVKSKLGTPEEWVEVWGNDAYLVLCRRVRGTVPIFAGHPGLGSPLREGRLAGRGSAKMGLSPLPANRRR